MTHPRTPPQRAYCLAREAAIVTITQRQATTASRNARVTRCLKQDPTRLYKDATSSLPDATSSLKRRTRECSFREKTILACWSTQGRWSSATQTGGSAAWRTTTTVVPYHQHGSFPKSVLNSLNSLVQQKSGAERCKLNMHCTCRLLILTLWSVAAGCNNCMPMCIGSFSLHSK